uniref:Uncharacterized protein n=1 Tax=Rhizophora mucronata TaxID=61149 RepID=A0A2P2N9I2_RHIMU
MFCSLFFVNIWFTDLKLGVWSKEFD